MATDFVAAHLFEIVDLTIRFSLTRLPSKERWLIERPVQTTCTILTLEVTNDNFHSVHRLEPYIVVFFKNHCIANSGRKNINKIPLCCKKAPLLQYHNNYYITICLHADIII